MKYYSSGKFESWDYIEAHGLNFNRGNIIKYITRAGKKDKDNEISDLIKALTYLEREIILCQERKKLSELMTR